MRSQGLEAPLQGRNSSCGWAVRPGIEVLPGVGIKHRVSHLESGWAVARQCVN